MSIEGEVSFVLIAITALMILLVAFLLLFGVLYQRSRLKRQLEKANYEKALLTTELEIRELTLRDISRDLHDNFGQIVSLVKIQMNLLSNELSLSDKMKVDESKELLQELVNEIRHLSNALNSRKIRQRGWVGMIKDDVARLNNLEILQVEFDLIEPIPELSPYKQVFLYRIFQELMNNVLKHSEASSAKVRLVSDEHEIIFSIQDNGVGANSLKTRSNSETSNGITNMQERARLIGATFAWKSNENEGTYSEIKLPITAHYEK